MNQASHHATRPRARIHRTFLHDARIHARHLLDDVFKLEIRAQLAFFLDQAIYRRIAQHALSVAQGAHHQARIEFRCSDDGLLNIFMHWRFFRRDKARAHVHTIRTE